MSQGFRCQLAHVDGTQVMVSVFGDLDLATVPAFLRALGPCAAHRPVFDLTQTTFLDGSGLRALVLAARVEDGEVAPMICPPGAPRRMLELTGIDRLFAFYESIDSWMAVRSDGASAPTR